MTSPYTACFTKNLLCKERSSKVVMLPELGCFGHPGCFGHFAFVSELCKKRAVRGLLNIIIIIVIIKIVGVKFHISPLTALSLYTHFAAVSAVSKGLLLRSRHVVSRRCFRLTGSLVCKGNKLFRLKP